MTWQLQEARSKFSEVVEASLQQGPQIIIHRDKKTAVVLSYKEYQRLTKPKQDLKELLMSTDFHGLDLTRDRSPTGRGTDPLADLV